MDRFVSAPGSSRRRILAGAGAAALAISSLALVASPAGASSGPKGKTQCATVTGTVTGTIQLTNCVDVSGADTGGSSVSFPTGNLANGGTITWTSGKTTTTGAPQLAGTNAKKCPGYVKGGSSNPSALKVSGTVTADTSGMKVPGKYKGAVCVSQSGDISALKPFKFN